MRFSSYISVLFLIVLATHLQSKSIAQEKSVDESNRSVNGSLQDSQGSQAEKPRQLAVAVISAIRQSEEPERDKVEEFVGDLLEDLFWDLASKVNPIFDWAKPSDIVTDELERTQLKICQPFVRANASLREKNAVFEATIANYQKTRKSLNEANRRLELKRQVEIVANDVLRQVKNDGESLGIPNNSPKFDLVEMLHSRAMQGRQDAEKRRDELHSTLKKNEQEFFNSKQELVENVTQYIGLNWQECRGQFNTMGLSANEIGKVSLPKSLVDSVNVPPKTILNEIDEISKKIAREELRLRLESVGVIENPFREKENPQVKELIKNLKEIGDVIDSVIERGVKEKIDQLDEDSRKKLKQNLEKQQNSPESSVDIFAGITNADYLPQLSNSILVASINQRAPAGQRVDLSASKYEQFVTQQEEFRDAGVSILKATEKACEALKDGPNTDMKGKIRDEKRFLLGDSAYRQILTKQNPEFQFVPEDFDASAILDFGNDVSKVSMALVNFGILKGKDAERVTSAIEKVNIATKAISQFSSQDYASALLTVSKLFAKSGPGIDSLRHSQIMKSFEYLNLRLDEIEKSLVRIEKQLFEIRRENFKRHLKLMHQMRYQNELVQATLNDVYDTLSADLVDAREVLRRFDEELNYPNSSDDESDGKPTYEDLAEVWNDDLGNQLGDSLRKLNSLASSPWRENGTRRVFLSRSHVTTKSVVLSDRTYSSGSVGMHSERFFEPLLRMSNSRNDAEAFARFAELSLTFDDLEVKSTRLGTKIKYQYPEFDRIDNSTVVKFCDIVLGLNSYSTFGGFNTSDRAQTFGQIVSLEDLLSPANRNIFVRRRNRAVNRLNGCLSLVNAAIAQEQIKNGDLLLIDAYEQVQAESPNIISSLRRLWIYNRLNEMGDFIEAEDGTPFFRSGGEDFVRNFVLFFALKRAGTEVTPSIYRFAFDMPPNKPEFLSLILGKPGRSEWLGDRQHCEFQIRYLDESGPSVEDDQPSQIRGNQGQSTNGWHIIFDSPKNGIPLAVPLPTPERFESRRFHVSPELLQLGLIRERILQQSIDLIQTNKYPNSPVRLLNLDY